MEITNKDINHIFRGIYNFISVNFRLQLHITHQLCNVIPYDKPFLLIRSDKMISESAKLLFDRACIINLTFLKF